MYKYQIFVLTFIRAKFCHSKVCTFSVGDGTGGIEQEITQDWLNSHNEPRPTNENECAALVYTWKTNITDGKVANGATVYNDNNNNGNFKCYAELDATGQNSNGAWRTCLFPGKDQALYDTSAIMN